jgi:acetyl-CoA C-acetyltransferase
LHDVHPQELFAQILRALEQRTGLTAADVIVGKWDQRL